MSFERQLTLPSPTGAMLNLFVQPSASLRGVVQISHGLAEHAARYARFAAFLAHRGWSTYAHDHRGHGRTTAPNAPLGRFAPEKNGARLVVADTLAVHDLIAAEHPGLPVIAFGHSMGGLIALNFVARHPGRVAAAAVWNANFQRGALAFAARALLAWERLRRGSDVPSRLLPRLTFHAWGAAVAEARTAFDWLSHDPAEVDAYVADPLCGWDASVSMWRDVFELAGVSDSALAPVPRTMPFHLVGGTEDPATSGGEAVGTLVSRLQRLGFSNLRSKIYAGNRHESLNELNRDRVMEDFAAWLDRAVGAKAGA